MNQTEKEISPEKIACESCGESFECGAKTGHCWCFSIAIEPENLAQLKEQFQNCLCSKCLQKSSQLNENTIKTNNI